jgi:DNA-binding MarR family transcriptional regulator
MTEPDFAILVTAASRCIADRLLDVVAAAGGDQMRPSFGFVLRAVAAEEPTVSRLAELLGVTKQAASRLVDDMVELGYLRRSERADDRRRKRLHLSPTGQRIRDKALAESQEMEAELRHRFGAAAVDDLRNVLIGFVESHGGGEELAAQRSRVSGLS